MNSSIQSASYLHEIDDATAELILQIQLANLEDLKDSRPGKQREHTADDSEIATRLLEESLGDVQSQLADRRMTKSIAQAVQARWSNLD